jgi:hypothetical protein
MIWVLTVLLILSLAANGYQYYRWHSYRSKPAGIHSHTGMMPKVDRDEILRDRERIKREKNDGEEPGTDVFRSPGGGR